MNKLLPLGLKLSKKIVTKRIKALGNLISDTLWLLETQAIKKTGSKLYAQRINTLIDLYAKQFDELLVKQERRIFEDMEKLFEILLSDLDSIRNDSLKFYKNTIKDTL